MVDLLTSWPEPLQPWGPKQRRSDASKDGSPIDDRGRDPLAGHLWRVATLFGSNRQGTPMASGDGQLCEPPVAQALPRAAQSIPELTVTEHISCHEALPSGWSPGADRGDGNAEAQR